MKKINFYKSKAAELRKKLFEKFFLLQEGHPGSVFSILDVLVVLYYGKFVKIKNGKLTDDVIMSKGHATVAQYPILSELKIITKKDWNNWGKNLNTSLRMFGNHKIPGIKVSSGSLGHGIGLATGIGFSAKKNKKKKQVYVIISEGELYEGSTWESLLLLAELKLDNVFIILDINNNIILGDPKKCLSLGNIKNKFKSFDIYTDECDGHNFISIQKKLKKMNQIKKPKCLIVNTIKGKGFKMMENKSKWHYWNQITNQEYKNSLLSLESKQ